MENHGCFVVGSSWTRLGAGFEGEVVVDKVALRSRLTKCWWGHSSCGEGAGPRCMGRSIRLCHVHFLDAATNWPTNAVELNLSASLAEWNPRPRRYNYVVPRPHPASTGTFNSEYSPDSPRSRETHPAAPPCFSGPSIRGWLNVLFANIYEGMLLTGTCCLAHKRPM